MFFSLLLLFVFKFDNRKYVEKVVLFIKSSKNVDEQIFCPAKPTEKSMDDPLCPQFWICHWLFLNLFLDDSLTFGVSPSIEIQLSCSYLMVRQNVIFDKLGYLILPM